MSNISAGTTRNYPTVDYDQHARTCSPGDFWGQVKRTVRGKAIPDEHIEMIVDAIRTQLAPQQDDVLLDLACGNGALSQRLFETCAQFVGVDLSTYLIEVANEHFAQPPRVTFAACSAVDYLREETTPQRFTKVLCYGSFAYFSAEDARDSLQLLQDRFVNVDTIFIGNLPDRDRAEAFYAPRVPEAGELDDHCAQIGIWRSRATFAALARAAGWEATFSTMPSSFFSVHYRYDVTLRRIESRGASGASR